MPKEWIIKIIKDCTEAVENWSKEERNFMHNETYYISPIKGEINGI